MISESDASAKPIRITVVGKRCVYINNYRVAGSKPYVSEHLTEHDLNTTLGEVLNAFSDADISKALKERKERRKAHQAPNDAS